MKELGRQIICIILLPVFLSGCGHFNDARQTRSMLEQANRFFSEGNYAASLGKYQQALEKDPASRDKVLFEMGVIHAYPNNEQKDYRTALDCFQKLLKEHPESGYKHDSEMMIVYINNVILKDKEVTFQQRQIEDLQQEVKRKTDEIAALQKKSEDLQQRLFSYALRYRSADKILVEKKDRLLKLLSRGEVLKTYKIALGGDPAGPKERVGDNKTPEGIYFIDGRNKQSRYHLSLHISYPNERDRKRAKELGVAPGGDIMIHGIKNGLSWVGGSHREADWTQGCIAVTDEEIEEIAKLVPNGTVVEIRP